jgi:hypothetical protein
MRIIGGIVLILALLELASLLFVPCLMGVFYLKYLFSHPTAEQWDVYFQSISNRGYLVRFWAICLVPTLVVSVLGYGLFGLFGFSHPALLGLVTFLLGVARIAMKGKRHKKEMLEKLRALRSATGGRTR